MNARGPCGQEEEVAEVCVKWFDGQGIETVHGEKVKVTTGSNHAVLGGNAGQDAARGDRLPRPASTVEIVPRPFQAAGRYTRHMGLFGIVPVGRAVDIRIFEVTFPK